MRKRAPAVIAASLALALPALAASPALAEGVWSDLRDELYAERKIAPAGDVIRIEAPYRTQSDLRTPLGATLRAPVGELIKRVTLVIDENPMPVSAVFDLAEPRAAFSFSAKMRMNGPSPVHVVVETDAGSLYMAESYVKTSGVGACAAPPTTDPVAALKSIGRMRLAMLEDGARSGARKNAAWSVPRVRLDISHPSHSGMQMDQISLLYIPARFVERLEVSADERPLFSMTGSISMSENPELEFELPAHVESLKVRLLDTEGSEVEQSFAVRNLG